MSGETALTLHHYKGITSYLYFIRRGKPPYPPL
jgi:hypothetical protein